MLEVAMVAVFVSSIISIFVSESKTRHGEHWQMVTWGFFAIWCVLAAILCAILLAAR